VCGTGPIFESAINKGHNEIPRAKDPIAVPVTGRPSGCPAGLEKTRDKDLDEIGRIELSVQIRVSHPGPSGLMNERNPLVQILNGVDLIGETTFSTERK
jgi:hypothetical protein